MTLRVSAPGKTILMGEHAAVYGRPALVAAVGRRLEVCLAFNDSSSIRLELPAVGVSATTDWASLAAETRRAREQWLELADAPSAEGFRRLRGDDPAFLVRIALGETAAWIERRSGLPVDRGLDVRVTSDLPVGSGFGSSAAVAVGVAKGLAGLAGVEPTAEDLQALALDIERRQHGLPSGVDTAAVIHGGVVWTQRDDQGDLQVEPVDLVTGALDRVRILNTGEPVESTGEVVAAVRERWQSDRRGVTSLLDRMERATVELRSLLAQRSMPEADSDSLVPLFREFEACLEALGVVPEEVQTRLRALEALGGAGKISGAGTLTGSGAGSLLVYHRRPERIAGCIADLPSLDAPLGAPGVRIEDRG